ncbi:MAG TPA: hypothetical protein VKB78_11160, partial [Pirellulales bacterium]|nr:hypothetical protein [Pirellulales bacterium]
MADRALAQYQDATHAITPLVGNRPAKALGQTLKIVAFNAKGGRRFEGTIACLKRQPLADADVILFCEADWNHWRSNWRKFAAEIADSLNMSFAYHGEFGKPEQVGEPITFRGNAILCSQPLEAAHTIPIPNGWVHRRLRRLI